MKANLPGKISKVLSWFYEIFYGFGEAYWDRENKASNKQIDKRERKNKVSRKIRLSVKIRV